MILDRLMDKLSSYWSWLYYRHWAIWELKIAVITIAAILLALLLWLIAWRRRKIRARIARANQGTEGSSVIGVNKGEQMMKKIAIVAIIIAGLIDLGIFCYRRPKPIKEFYFRSHQTGKLIGPVSLPRGHLQPPLDEQTYIAIEPAESEIEVRKRLLRLHVKVSFTDIPLTEALNHILTAYFGSEAPPVRIEVADESKMPQISIDVRNNALLYEVLFNLASQANVYISIENGTIVMSQKEFKV